MVALSASLLAALQEIEYLRDACRSQKVAITATEVSSPTSSSSSEALAHLERAAQALSECDASPPHFDSIPRAVEIHDSPELPQLPSLTSELDIPIGTSELDTSHLQQSLLESIHSSFERFATQALSQLSPDLIPVSPPSPSLSLPEFADPCSLHLDSLSQRIDQLEGSCARLAALLQRKMHRNMELCETNLAMRKQLEELQQQLSLYQSRSHESDQALSATRSELESWRHQYEQSRTAIVVLEQSYSQLQQQLQCSQLASSKLVGQHRAALTDLRHAITGQIGDFVSRFAVELQTVLNALVHMESSIQRLSSRVDPRCVDDDTRRNCIDTTNAMRQLVRWFMSMSTVDDASPPPSIPRALYKPMIRAVVPRRLIANTSSSSSTSLSNAAPSSVSIPQQPSRPRPIMYSRE